METAEVNQFGNEVIRSFEGDIDRYKFDFGLCRPPNFGVFLFL